MTGLELTGIVVFVVGFVVALTAIVISLNDPE
jgi:hypothetical protein